MRTILYAFYIFVTVICAESSKQIMQRLLYIENRIDHIEERMNAENKLRREDFSAIFDKLEQIQSKLDNRLIEVDKEQMATSQRFATATPIGQSQNGLQGTLYSLVEGFKSEKVQNLRWRREIPAMIENIQLLIEDKNRRTRTDQQIMKDLDIIRNTTSDILDQTLNTLKEKQETIEIAVSHKFNVLHNKTTELYFENYDRMLRTLENMTLVCSAVNNSNIVSPPVEKNTAGKDECITCSSCADLYNFGVKHDGVYQINLNGKKVSVFCDMTTDGGGWNVFQRRLDGSVDFYRGWGEYKTGFGDLNGEFWLGNEYLHEMTITGKPKELRIELTDYWGDTIYATYTGFMIRAENDAYKLTIIFYNGNASDSLFRHNNHKFSTKDKDNDMSDVLHCAQERHGAWWYDDCTDSNLNGFYEKSSTCTRVEYSCIHWYFFKRDHRPFKFTEMKFR